LKRVLIVDDSAFMRKMILSNLSKYGYTLAGEAGNGEDAVSAYVECRPDIVTLDITMPVLDGIGALKEILEVDPKAICVIISALGQDVLINEALQRGAKGFVIKPFNGRQLVDALEKAFGNEQIKTEE
jgi:two-component system chemotaxis response regulator CheY